VRTRDRFEERLPSRLEELAAPRTPSYFDDVIHTTAQTRQRPGWSFPERWFPMSAVSDRLVTVPRGPIRLVAVAILVILAITGLLIIASGARHSTVPAPFGVAGNGQVAWIDGHGSIVAAHPGTDEDARVLVAGPGIEAMQFSPDGTKILYVRSSDAGRQIAVANADGSTAAVLASGGPSIDGFVWAPDGVSVVIQHGGRLERVALDAGTQPQVLLEDFAERLDWNVSPNRLFRPPTGEQIAFIRDTGSGKAVVLANADGSQRREILSPGDSGLRYLDLASLTWSPDGEWLAVTVDHAGTDGEWRVYVMRADGSDVHRLTNRSVDGAVLSEANPAWSPDGRFIAMQRWFTHDESLPTPTRPLTVVDVATGDEREVGSISSDGFDGWGWSPDGRSIIATPGGSKRISVIDVSTGEPHSDGWQAAAAPSWQRVAP
jgi:dipeptidyl aminopeptidase/acylaminoacyl peptidase